MNHFRNGRLVGPGGSGRRSHAVYFVDVRPLEPTGCVAVSFYDVFPRLTFISAIETTTPNVEAVVQFEGPGQVFLYCGGVRVPLEDVISIANWHRGVARIRLLSDRLIAEHHDIGGRKSGYCEIAVTFSGS